MQDFAKEVALEAEILGRSASKMRGKYQPWRRPWTQMMDGDPLESEGSSLNIPSVSYWGFPSAANVIFPA